jgi:hypothetical protein
MTEKLQRKHKDQREIIHAQETRNLCSVKFSDLKIQRIKTVLLAKLQLSTNSETTLPTCKPVVRPADITCTTVAITCTGCTITRVLQTAQPHTCDLFLLFLPHAASSLAGKNRKRMSKNPSPYLPK